MACRERKPRPRRRLVAAATAVFNSVPVGGAAGRDRPAARTSASVAPLGCSAANSAKILHLVVSRRTRSITSCLLLIWCGFGDSILATSEPFTARDLWEPTDRIERKEDRMRTIVQLLGPWETPTIALLRAFRLYPRTWLQHSHQFPWACVHELLMHAFHSISQRQ